MSMQSFVRGSGARPLAFEARARSSTGCPFSELRADAVDEAQMRATALARCPEPPLADTSEYRERELFASAGLGGTDARGTAPFAWAAGDERAGRFDQRRGALEHALRQADASGDGVEQEHRGVDAAR